ncbi:MAG: hypothetical protein IKG18_17080 [Atopobiaceae bacterium]|nr:hypothetical protein [Atopobiaceae bacterium]MBR3315840.1 hypothetical protein [Atopobiaceae bacterium]
MAQLIDITRVVVGTEYLTATVHISNDGPLMTSEDLEATTRVYNLLPTIIDHACAGDAGMTFKDCMGDTEIAHLLEHVTVELLARSNLTDEVIAGRTWRELAYDRTYSIQLPCIDDVLVSGALSSAIWIVTWAFTGGAGAVPDVDATVKGLVQLVQSLPVEGEGGELPADEPVDDYFEEDAAEEFDDSYDDDFGPDADYDDYEDEEFDRGPSMSQKII